MIVVHVRGTGAFLEGFINERVDRWHRSRFRKLSPNLQLRIWKHCKFTSIRNKRDKEREAATAHNDKVAKQRKGNRKLKGVPVPRPFGLVTAVRVRATLSSALAAAVEQGEVVRNVAQQTRQKRRQGPSRPRPKVWQPQQLAAFLD
ncbi:hypothetical protein ABZ328_26670 [Micromonospora aurantiaca]|uniref:hypothetical protein n=1 Tax=Micromonospora aurantiaca (nom. illeg.) TaxID=47850 RepID=UPI0033C14F36